MSDSTAHERVEASSPDSPSARHGWARRTLSIATTVLLIGVSLLALFTVVIPFVLGAQSYTVLTGSMRPGFEPGTLIAVRATDPEEIRIGDVITYQLEPGRPEVVTHRVVGSISQVVEGPARNPPRNFGRGMAMLSHLGIRDIL